MSLLIGFGSKARQGKDSAVETILEHVNGSIKKVEQFYGPSTNHTKAHHFRFAAALYEEARTLHGMTEKDAPLLQRIGSDRRKENVNYWVNKVFAAADALPKGRNVVLISDVRYLNEAAEIKRRGGFLVNVTRLNEDGSQFVAPDRPANHPSEIELDGYNWDYFIRTKSGEQALAAEYTITLFEYLRGLHDTN